MTMTIKEAITYFCKREYNALRLDCNKPIKYRDVSDKRLLEAHKVLIDNNIERVGSGLFKKGDKLIAKRIITFSERRAHLCYYPTKMTIKFMEAQGLC